jgi:uncharacterized repeat protein (TIGR01451 family)
VFAGPVLPLFRTLVPAAPTITSISPPSPTPSSADQNVSVSGSEFQLGLTVSVTFPDGGSATLSGTQILNVTPTSFVMVITLNAVGTWKIRVKNPDASESNTFSFTVENPPTSGLRIDSISPANPTASALDQSVAVFGSGFQQGLTVSVNFPSGGSSSLSGTQIQSVTSTSFVMLITLNGTGSWSLRVGNPDGLQSNTFSFAVNAPSGGPRIDSISPPSPVSSPFDQNVTVFGIGFQPGLTVSVTSPGGGSTTLSGTQIQNMTATLFVMVITLNGTGSWSIRVNNPEGTASNEFAFAVQAASGTPNISAILPSTPIASSFDQNVTVFGRGFEDGLTVTVTFPSGGASVLSGTQIQDVTSSLFIMRITLNGTGVWTIRVNNRFGASSNTFAFTVQQSLNTVPPPPRISSTSPSALTASNFEQSMTILGDGFQPGLIVILTPPTGDSFILGAAQIQNVTSTSLSVAITPSSIGLWMIAVSNPDRGRSAPFGIPVVQPGIDLSADVAVTSSATPSPVAAGTRLTYTITVTNFGPNVATDVTLSDALPAATTFASVATSQGAATPLPEGTVGIVTCSLGTIAIGSSANITLTVNVLAAPGLTISNVAEAKSTTNDPIPGNNTATTSILVKIGAVVALSWDQPPSTTSDPTPAPRNLRAGPGVTLSSAWELSGRGFLPADTSCTLLKVNIYKSDQPNILPVPNNLWKSVPPELLQTTMAAAPSGSFYVLTNLWQCGQSIIESGRSNEASASGAMDPVVNRVSVGAKIKAKGSGFTDLVEVFIDGVGFKKQAAVSGGVELTQKGLLTDGRSIEGATPFGRTVMIKFVNSDGGATTVPFARDSFSLTRSTRRR